MTTKPITRARIGSALLHLGFRKGRSGNCTVYGRDDVDAFVIEPEEFTGDYGLQVFMNTARTIVVARGLATADHFEWLVTKPLRGKPSSHVLKSTELDGKKLSHARTLRLAAQSSAQSADNQPVVG